jgi:predicted transcriptional regulator
MASRIVGVRLPPDLERKFELLCAAADRRPSVVLRVLVAAATPAQVKAWAEAQDRGGEVPAEGALV